VAFCLSLSVGHIQGLQITIIRSVMFSSSCYHLPTEYGTRCGDRSVVRKGAVSPTGYTAYSNYGNDALTDVTAEIY